jgi:hypothetical protein
LNFQFHLAAARVTGFAMNEQSSKANKIRQYFGLWDIFQKFDFSILYEIILETISQQMV